MTRPYTVACLLVAACAGRAAAGAPDADVIARVTGLQPEVKNGVAKVSVPRADLAVTVDGVKMQPFQGLTSWAAFAGSPEAAVVDGDFAMREAELQPVLKALRAARIDVVAIHSHMTHEEPRIMFLHFWGKGSAEALAREIKAARATQK
jgi:hypothetical protein